MALVLGGVSIDYPRGLAGHSDGDVIAHALIDAILGAANLGDIGSLFPSGDEQYRGASSLDLLWEAYREVREAGWELVNADCVLVGEEPRIGDVRDEMCERLAGALGIEPGRVTVRATTTDGLGFTGPRRGPRGAGRRTPPAMNVVRYADRPDLRAASLRGAHAADVSRVHERERAGRPLLGSAVHGLPGLPGRARRRRRPPRRGARHPAALGRLARGSAVGLGRRVRARHDLRSPAHGAHGDRDQRRAEPARPAALEPDDPDVHRQRSGCGLSNGVIAPVRPTWKERYPLIPIERTSSWRRADGSHFDPWIRVHEVVGGEIIALAPRVDDHPRQAGRVGGVDGDGVPGATATTSFPAGLATRSRSTTASARTSSRTSGCCHRLS